MTALQVIIWDFRTQVVDVVEAYISGEPLDDAWRFKERASMQGHLHVVPLLVVTPDHIFKLVLNIE